jgi:hypothetical protein
VADVQPYRAASCPENLNGLSGCVKSTTTCPAPSSLHSKEGNCRCFSARPALQDCGSPGRSYVRSPSVDSRSAPRKPNAHLCPWSQPSLVPEQSKQSASSRDMIPPPVSSSRFGPSYNTMRKDIESDFPNCDRCLAARNNKSTPCTYEPHQPCWR